MFCSKCGTQFADGSAFCPICGTPVNAAPQQPQQPVYQQPVQPQYQQPVYQQPAQPQYQQPAAAGGVADLQKIWHFIIAGIAVFALIVGFMNLFSLMDLPVSGDDGYSMDLSVDLLSRALDMSGDSFTMGYIANILMGLTSLAAAAIGALYFLKKQMNMPYYDYIGKLVPGIGAGLIAGGVGVVGCILQFILMLTVGPSEISVGVPTLTWIALVIYGVLAAGDYFVINKKK